MAEPAQHIPDSLPRGHFSELSQLIEGGIEQELFPCAVCELRHRGELLWTSAQGNLWTTEDEDSSPQANEGTVFDVDRLSASLVTTTLMMHFVSHGRIRLDDLVARHVHGFGVHGKSPISIRQVLSHAAGFPTTLPFREELEKSQGVSSFSMSGGRGASQYVSNRINRSKLRAKPGSGQLKSDVSYFLLGHLLEVVTGMSLSKAAEKYLFAPLGLRGIGYINLQQLCRGHVSIDSSLVAPTGECDWRLRFLQGEVSDETTWMMGGCSGAAGIFSTASDLSFLCHLLIECFHGRSEFISQDVISEFWGISGGGSDELRLGWDGARELVGSKISSVLPYEVSAVGKTGCAIWIRPEKEWTATFLSNRFDPVSSMKKMSTFWSKFFERASQLMERVSG
ncbi:MAG: beta-lactamase family protein [Bdellovibrionales bacterium]|nr:beta-lactamase family protein [Bdellovibrionales bacterium]